MSRTGNELPQRDAPGTGVAGSRRAQGDDLPETPTGPGAGEAVEQHSSIPDRTPGGSAGIPVEQHTATDR